MVAGFITTVASLPLDIAKTRIQNMKVVNGVPEYKGMLDVMGKVTFQNPKYLNKLFSKDRQIGGRNITVERFHALLRPNRTTDSCRVNADGCDDDAV